MTLLAAARLERRFADRVVFREVTFRVASGDRVGLVGPNGCGKTTLLRLLAGRDLPDAGSVTRAGPLRVGYLEQELLGTSSETVESYVHAAGARLEALEAELRALEPRLAGEAAALERYGETAAAFEHAGGYAFGAQVERVLDGLGLGGLPRTRPVAALSGGERTRLGLARLLLEDPDLLLLDEPTNHLDLDALEWLERFLLERDRTLIAVSHDRYFLDRVTTRTLGFAEAGAGARGSAATLRAYRGGYSAFARQRAAELESRGRAHERERQEVARQRAFIERERAGQRARQARSREKQLARRERITAPERAATIAWRLRALPLGSVTVLETTPLAIGFDRGRPLVRTPDLRVERGARVAIVGANGSGKTTLLRSLLGELPLLQGYVRAAPGARVAAFAQSQTFDAVSGTVLDALREWAQDEQEARDLLARFLFRGDGVFRDAATLSGGERSRLALARLAARPANLLVLDEPTNHLDLPSREALEEVLAGYEGTVVVVSHDRYLLDRLATEVWLLDAGRLRRFAGNYTEMRRRLDEEEPAREAGGGERESPSRRRDGVARGGGRPRRPRRRPGERAVPPAARFAEIESRIEDLERRLEALAQRVGEVAQAGNYLEARRVGEEYAELEHALRDLYAEAAHDE